MKIFRMFLFTTCMVSLVSLVSAQELLIHKTKDGDTLWDISEKYLQTPWLWMAIADYNKLKNPHFILPGDMIKIPEVPQVKVTEVFGDVTIKRIGTNKYVNLRRGDNVYPHDEVVVGPDSTAQIEFEDKSILQLKPETSLVLKHSVYAEKVKAVNTKVKLLHGKMSFKGTKTTGSNFEIETPGVFCGVRGTEFEIGYTPDGLSSISVFQGEVLASSTGKAVNVPAGFGIQSVKGELPSPPKPLPKSPELIKPVDDFITGILTLTFSWKSVPEAAKYYLEIAKDEAFNNVVYRVQGTESTSVVSTTLPVGKYYWRVRSIDKSGLEGKFSNARILRIVRKLQLEIVPDSPLFKKESILYAHISCQYTLKPLDADTSIVRIIAAIDNDDFYTYHQPISFNKAGTHTIKYKGVDAFGNSGEIDKFIVVVDNIPPEVQIDIDHKSGSFVHPQTIFSLAASDNAAGVAEVQCKIDNEEWKRYTGAFSISQEGNHQIGFRAVDTVGNQSMEKMVDVIVDRTPPEVQMDIDRKSGNFVHPQTKFSLIASDNAAGVAEVQCKIDNEEWKRYTGAFSISQEGSHQIGFRAVDTVGNQSKEKVIDVIVDHTPPEIKIDIDRKSGNFVHPQTKFSLIASDNAAGVAEVQCKIDNEEWKRYTGAFSISQEGSHQIGFRAVDTVGNQSKEKVIDVIVDHTPPEIKIDIDRKSGCFVHPQTKFSLIASDSAAGVAEVQCKIDNEEWKRYTGAFSIVQEGIHQIGFRAVDTLGNQSKEKIIDVIVDRTPPEVQMDIDRKSGSFVHPQTIFSLAASDSTAGVAEVLYKIDDKEWKKYTGAFSILQEGSHQIGFQAIDTVGNQSKENVLDIIVDNTPPEVKIDIDRKSGNFVHPQTKFSLIASDNAAGVAEVQCKIDNEEWKRYTGTFSILQEGSHQIGFRAIDTVGNQSKEKVIDVIVDNTPPEIKIDIDRKSGCFVHPQTKFSLIASDNAAGVAEVQCKIDNEEWKRYTGAFSIVQEGIHQIGFRAIDTVGNQSKEKTIDVIVDNTPPDVQMDIDRKSGSFVRSDTQFSLIGIDDAAGVAEVIVKIDNEAWMRYAGTFSIFQEGSHWIRFQAIDNVGNQSKEKIVNVIVDRTPPGIKMDIDHKSGCFVRSDTKFSLIASDDASGVAEFIVKIDNEAWKNYSGTFSLSQEGNHQIGFQAMDTLGNQSKEKIIDVIVDNTAPEVQMDIDRKSGSFVHPQTKFSLIASDNASGVDEVLYRLDNKEWKRYTDTFSISQEGIHQIEFRAIDSLGNQSKEQVTNVIVDQTPPVVKMDIDRKFGSFVHPQTGFSLTAIDELAGVAEVLCKIDNEEWKKYPGTFSISQEGGHRIGFQAIDNVGNPSKEQIIDVIVDSTPPEVQMDIDRKSGCFVHSQTKFSLLSRDDASGVMEVLFRIDNDEWKRYNAAFSIALEGSHQIEFRVADNIGNQSKEKVVNVIVDNTPPEIKIEIDRKSGCFVHPHTRFSIITSDNASGVAEVLCKIDDEEWKKYDATFSIAQEGRHKIRISAIDTIGNQTMEKEIDVIVDNTAPEVKMDIDRKSGCFVHPQTRFSLAASDDVAGVGEVIYRIDNEKWKKYTGAFSISQSGNHRIGFRAIDTVGNQSKEEITDVIVDNTPPEVQMDIDHKSGCFVHPHTRFSIITTDNVAGVAEVLYRIDNKGWKRYSGTFSISLEGSHKIGIVAIDTVGNQSKEMVTNIIVDNTPPAVKIDVDRKSGNFVHPQTRFSLIASDNASGVAEVLYKIDNEEWKRYPGPFSISQAGIHRIGFQAKDNIGNQSKEQVLDVIVDNTPPEIKIDIDHKSGCFVHSQTRFSLVAIDDVAGVGEVIYRIDNEKWKKYTGAFSISREGNHRIGFRAADTVGNQSKENVLDVIVDNTPPEIRIDIDRKSGNFVHPQSKFSLIASDNASGLTEVLYKIDNEEWKRYNGLFSISQEGNHQIGFRAADTVGNQSKENVIDVIVDNTPPEIKIDIDRKSGSFVHPQTKFSLIASDNASGVTEVQCKIDNEKWKRYMGAFSIVEEGIHQIGFRAIDPLGNLSEEKMVNIIVDRTPPEVQIDIDRKFGCFVHSQTKFSLIAIDDVCGVSEVLYRLDNNKEWKRYSGTFSLSQEGSHRIGFRAVDMVGNQSKEQVLDVIVDNTPPEIKIELDRRAGSFIHPHTRFSLIAGDNAAGVAEVLCKIDDEEWKRYTGAFSISQEGSHRIGFRAVDMVGNQSKEQMLDVIVDNTPPEIKIEIDRKSGSFVHPHTRFSLIAGDNTSGVAEVLCKIDNGDWKRYNGAFSIADEGNHRIGFRAIDTVGNQSKEEIVDVIVDRTPPEVKIEIDRCVQLDSRYYVHSDARFSLIAIDDAAGVAEVLYRLDDGEWKKYEGAFSISLEGIHRIGGQAIDTVGNQSKEKVIDVIVEK